MQLLLVINKNGVGRNKKLPILLEILYKTYYRH